MEVIVKSTVNEITKELLALIPYWPTHADLLERAADRIERLGHQNAEMRRTFGSHPLNAEMQARGWLAAIEAVSSHLEKEAQACESDEYRDVIRHLATVMRASCLPPRPVDSTNL